LTLDIGGFTQRRKGGKGAKRRNVAAMPRLQDCILCAFAAFASLRESDLFSGNVELSLNLIAILAVSFFDPKNRKRSDSKR
jgi:hypothetical protein